MFNPAQAKAETTIKFTKLPVLIWTDILDGESQRDMFAPENSNPDASPPVEPQPELTRGSFPYQDGSVYDGEWTHERQRWGQGKLTLADGCVYDGTWVRDKMHGQGKFTYTNGSFYEGGWAYGEQNGKGTFQYEDGSWYKGTWASGQPVETGLMYFSQDDCEHEGTWNEEGKFAGTGVGAAAAEERKE